MGGPTQSVHRKKPITVLVKESAPAPSVFSARQPSGERCSEPSASSDAPAVKAEIVPRNSAPSHAISHLGPHTTTTVRISHHAASPASEV